MRYIKPKNLTQGALGSAAGVGSIGTAVVAGTTAATGITVTGVGLADKLVGIIMLNRDATAANINISSLLSEASITAANTIRLSTTNSTGDTLLVIWQNGTT
jgi:hypothetical protein